MAEPSAPPVQYHFSVLLSWIRGYAQQEAQARKLMTIATHLCPVRRFTRYAKKSWTEHEIIP